MKPRPQRISWSPAAPNITVIKFTMTAMVGKPPRQINMPRLDAYEVLALAQLNVKTGVHIDAVNSGRVGAAFVNGDLLGQAMQVNGSLQITQWTLRA